MHGLLEFCIRKKMFVMIYFSLVLCPMDFDCVKDLCVLHEIHVHYRLRNSPENNVFI